jgi:hypothetical protein
MNTLSSVMFVLLGGEGSFCLIRLAFLAWLADVVMKEELFYLRV